MEVVFFIYGLAFFLLGFAILYYPKKNSAFQLASKIRFVGWFGIIHGINEWLDMLILVHALDISFVWETIRLFTLPVSFLALVYFGAEVISAQKKNCVACKLLTPALAVLWGILFLAGEHDQQKWDILSRYILCFPGAALTGLALFMYMPETKKSSSFRLAANLKVAGIAFIAYGLVAGLVVKDAAFFPASFLNYSLFSESLGVPVQIFRSLCAVIIAYNLIKVLEIFHLEMQQSLLNSEMRFRTVVNTAPVTLFIEDENHHVAFLEGKGLAHLNIMYSDAIGKPISQVFADLPQIYEGSERAFSTGEELTDIVAIQGYFLEVFFAPLKDEDGIVHGAIGVVIDVSEQKKAQKDLEKYRLEMEENKALATIGALSAEIAGQITGPLNESKISLLKALGGLRKTIGAADVKADISEGIEKISQATKTLDGFCTKANLQISPRIDPIDLFEVVQRILSVFRESAQHAMVRIATEGTDMFPVLGISSRELEQVLYIMIQNIIRSVDGIHLYNLKIHFSIQEEGFCVKFAEDCLCETLQDVEDSATMRSNIVATEGESNFDLSVLKGIVQAYGGTITITPNPQSGTFCEIRLPLFK
ncbi:MAG: hypothetical protein H8E62_07220 [Planctomycetes bacterium]|nr:hypothetical protein [Planctomycetota bacterium]